MYRGFTIEIAGGRVKIRNPHGFVVCDYAGSKLEFAHQIIDDMLRSRALPSERTSAGVTRCADTCSSV